MNLFFIFGEIREKVFSPFTLFSIAIVVFVIVVVSVVFIAITRAVIVVAISAGGAYLVVFNLVVVVYTNLCVDFLFN